MLIKSKYDTFALNKKQTEVQSNILKKITTKEYELVEIPCICAKYNNEDSGLNDKIVTNSFYPNFIDSEINIVICKRCGTLRSSPYLSKEAVVDYYTNYYRLLHEGIVDFSEEEKVAKGEYEGGQGCFVGCSAYNFLHPFVSEYKKIHQKDKVKVFEIGCGYGGNLLKFHKDGEHVYGCDYGEQGLEIAKKNGMENMYLGDVEVLRPFGIPDFVIINHCLEHIVDLKSFFMNLKDIISNETLVYIGVPNIITGPYHFNMNVYRIFEIAHVWHFSNNTLDALMAKEGFEKVESNEIIQAVYKYTGKIKEISLLWEYNKNKIALETFDKIFTRYQQLEQNRSDEKYVSDRNYKKYKKYKKYTKILLGVAVVLIGLLLLR